MIFFIIILPTSSSDMINFLGYRYHSKERNLTSVCDKEKNACYKRFGKVKFESLS